MLDKLKDAERRYMDIEGELASPDIFSDPEKYASLMKDYKGLTPIIEKFREYVCADNERSEAELLLSEPLEADMKELVLSELKESKIRIKFIWAVPVFILTKPQIFLMRLNITCLIITYMMNGSQKKLRKQKKLKANHSKKLLL